MRSSFVPIVFIALAATACVESEGNESADDVVVDSVSSTIPATGNAPSIGSGDISGSDDEPVAEPSDERDAVAIPARFRGEWNADRAACGTGSSETRLRISADRIRFYESTGVVSAVRVVSEGTIAVTATYQGEGETWQDERRLTLAQDGTLRVSGGGDLVRYRCP